MIWAKSQKTAAHVSDLIGVATKSLTESPELFFVRNSNSGKLVRELQRRFSLETESGKDGGAEEPMERNTGEEGDDFSARGFLGFLHRRSQRKERRLAAWLAVDGSVALDDRGYSGNEQGQRRTRIRSTTGGGSQAAGVIAAFKAKEAVKISQSEVFLRKFLAERTSEDFGEGFRQGASISGATRHLWHGRRRRWLWFLIRSCRGDVFGEGAQWIRFSDLKILVSAENLGFRRRGRGIGNLGNILVWARAQFSVEIIFQLICLDLFLQKSRCGV
ncbi:hypothetical protein U1Q18_004655 [Sarracenia purpurea var. burkii]